MIYMLFISQPQSNSSSNMMSLNEALGRDAHNYEPVCVGSNIEPNTIQSQEELKKISLERKCFPRNSLISHWTGLHLTPTPKLNTGKTMIALED